MNGYTVRFSADTIDEICDNISKYTRGDLMQAINDAWVQYQYGTKSKTWYEYVEGRLSKYV